MLRISQKIKYNYLIDFSPGRIRELMDEVADIKATLLTEALTNILGLADAKPTDAEIIYDGYHFVYYEHIRIGYISTTFEPTHITIEFNSIPP